MNSQNKIALRVLSGILLASFGMASGCNDTLPGGQTTKTTATSTTARTTTNTTTKATTTNTTTKAGGTTTNAPPAVVGVTGTWYYKKEIMRLKQSGSSIQGSTEVIGFVNNPADPLESPVPTVGSMQADGTVKVSEIINYIKHPAKNYTVDKVGKLKDANTLVLNVVKGQAPHTQTWIRK
ncbi:MAG: hypothetical protein U1F77_13520 [Kiritimatiellia bacterium]